jgi:1-hydroxycarotenoid 3,4-desaturase
VSLKIDIRYDGVNARQPRARTVTARVVIIGAGVGGLSAAIALAARGLEVTVVERHAWPGGKLREVQVGTSAIDCGPTVLTLRNVFDELFDEAGAQLDDYVTLQPAEILARHAWGPEQHLDLFADTERSATAIGQLAGAAAARGYRRFAAAAARLYATLEMPFLRAPRPRNALALASAVGARGLLELGRGSPFRSLWDVLGDYFADARLRQLFARYATYCGSSPFAAPATLIVVAHVEQRGVWLVAGGMARLAEALARLAARLGVELRYGNPAVEVTTEHDRVAGVTLADGERLRTTAVVANVDVAALAAGELGPAAQRAVAAAFVEPRSLSALTWSVEGNAGDWPLSRHNVFFSADYRREFIELFAEHRCPREPTVYVCAQDRAASAAPATRAARAERLFVLINAPAASHGRLDEGEIERCRASTWLQLQRCGLHLTNAAAPLTTTPADFARLFPKTNGALYGGASHGWRASFRRPTAATRLPGLYLAGGSTHPGPGLPLAALSGRIAAALVLAQSASTRPLRRTATHGGTSMR